MQSKVLISTLISATLVAFGSAQCACTHNSDAGRWIDDGRTPAEALGSITPPLNGGQECVSASTQGKMCVSGDTDAWTANWDCMKAEASADESPHGDWFLWTVIDCGALQMGMTAV